MNAFFKNLTFLLVVAGLAAGSTDASAWGQKGHDVVCKIAENHLTKRAQKKISAILEGKSIVYWGNWMDNASHTRQYAYTKTWHYKDVEDGKTYEETTPAAGGDVVTAIEAQIDALKSGTLNHEAQALALKMLVHLVGDLHCPMHMGNVSDAGGNLWQVQFFKNGKNLHSVWDSDVIESAHKWTYSEWAEQLDKLSRSEETSIIRGSIDNWGKETHLIALKIYEGTPKGSKLSYDYVNEWAPVAEQLLLRGGLRLAAILNDIF